MKRTDLEHLIRAAGGIANERELIVIGSQAILASIPNPPPELVVSTEADIYPSTDPSSSDLIDGSIGEGSVFHETFGYYAHGIRPETAVLPSNWKSRLVPIQNENTNQIAGLCLSLPDLIISKLAAAREKDLDFVRALFRHGLSTPQQIEAVLPELPPETRQLITPRLLSATRR